MEPKILKNLLNSDDIRCIFTKKWFTPGLFFFSALPTTASLQMV